MDMDLKGSLDYLLGGWMDISKRLGAADRDAVRDRAESIVRNIDKYKGMER